MRARLVQSTVETLVKAGQPLYLWGPPGIGKSDVVRQAAAAMDRELVDIRALLLDPVDLRGLPRIEKDGRTSWSPPDFLPVKGRGILFLDELNAAPPLVQAACYQLVLDRRIGDYKLPDGWSVVAAGNRETDRSVTHRMPSALANRFTHIDFEVRIEDWVDWALQEGIAPEVIAFLRFRPALLHHFDPTRNEKAFPTPRSWAFVSRILDATEDEEILSALVAGTVGAGAAAEFTGYLAVCRELPSAENLLSNPDTWKLPAEDPALLYALCELLASHASSKTFSAITRIASKLPVEFAVLLIRDAIRKDTRLVDTQEFILWAENHAEIFV
ncbi:dynein-related subfamily AAA family protein [Desulfobotulus alkaliphilus]|uniref:Dynein-related subfamily AAA family protein n=1 Tax=Desulfobotulus alkaliphilus TaxID=622671 RepID=A0A562S6A4_9BACT|nr:MoxR family ATPase [Desulfobotulus alkaliphilus]TWI76708.1 dynein-related subfamily AAA family protein [Desulfobotulus alkaliphilus]